MPVFGLEQWHESHHRPNSWGQSLTWSSAPSSWLSCLASGHWAAVGICGVRDRPRRPAVLRRLENMLAIGRPALRIIAPLLHPGGFRIIAGSVCQPSGTLLQPHRLRLPPAGWCCRWPGCCPRRGTSPLVWLAFPSPSSCPDPEYHFPAKTLRMADAAMGLPAKPGLDGRDRGRRCSHRTVKRPAGALPGTVGKWSQKTPAGWNLLRGSRPALKLWAFF